MNKISCPKCKAVLNPENKVVIAARKKDGDWGLILLSSQIGDYTVLNHESFHVTEGESVKLHCPACHTELSNYAPNKGLAGIELIDENNQKSVILISSVAGEHCTYNVVEGEVKAYGKDAGKYHFDYEGILAWV